MPRKNSNLVARVEEHSTLLTGEDIRLGILTHPIDIMASQSRSPLQGSMYLYGYLATEEEMEVLAQAHGVSL